MQGHCNDGESTYQAEFRVFSSEQIPATLSALPNKLLIHRLSLRNKFLANYSLVIKETHKHGLEL
jgi:hypothetical protein